MFILKRKQMETTEATLKIIVGIIFLVFVVGIFSIRSGLKQMELIRKNNALDAVALQVAEHSTTVSVNDFDGINRVLEINCIKCIRVSNLDSLSYLICEDNGIEKSICLGYVEANKTREFNNLFKNI